MQGSAQYPVGEEMASEGLLAAGLATGTDGGTGATLFEMGASSLREAAAARIAAHRSRRAGAQAAAGDDPLRTQQAQRERASTMAARRGAAKVRDAVRARYESSPSYRDFLAAEAERAIEQARAEAEVAARSAKAIAEAQMRLLEELRSEEPPFAAEHVEVAIEREGPEWAEAAPVGVEELALNSGEPTSGDLFAEPEASLREITTGGLTVRLYDVGSPKPAMPGIHARPWFADDPEMTSEELEELEQEIAFRRAPEFEEHILETLPLPANLIEFPRELVATRKARPRLAEGPLREDAAPEPQLRIFEVEPEQISTQPGAEEETASAAPVWQGLLLDAAPRSAAAQDVRRAAAPVDAAPISRRLMAAAVDACCVGTALVGFATVTAWISGPRLTALSRPMLVLGAVFTLAIAALLYQLLFFSLNEATPGMRYARIALCTFAETNPSRQAMRRRVMAMALAASPLGLGLVWAWMDDDRLAWHDRMSRMYQRGY